MDIIAVVVVADDGRWMLFYEESAHVVLRYADRGRADKGLS